MNETNKKSLTESQARVLYEICQYVRTYKKQPTLEEIAKRKNVSSNAVCYALKQLKKNGYIKGEPNSNSWKIVQWFDEPMGCNVPIMGYLYNGEPILYRDQPLGEVWLPIQIERFKGTLDDLFVLHVKKHRADRFPLRAMVDDLVIFQRHKHYCSGSIILATLNGRLGLFKYSPSRTQAILKKGKKQSVIPVHSRDEWNVLATMLMPFSKSEMRFL